MRAKKKPTIDFKVLDEAVKKVLAFKPKKKGKPAPRKTKDAVS